MTVEVLLVLDRWDVSEGAVEAVLVEPVHPVQGRQLEVVDAAPGSLVADALELVEPDQALGLGVVVGIADAADRRNRTGKGESVLVPNGGVLPASLC